MKEERDILKQAAERAARFDGDPREAVPCLQCGAAIQRDTITEPRFMLCRASCARRFNARMKADGRDPAKVAERGFFDAVGVTRAPGGHIPDPPLLPDAEAMLFYSTGTMRDMTPYRTEREMFTPCY